MNEKQDDTMTDDAAYHAHVVTELAAALDAVMVCDERFRSTTVREAMFAMAAFTAKFFDDNNVSNDSLVSFSKLVVELRAHAAGVRQERQNEEDRMVKA